MSFDATKTAGLSPSPVAGAATPFNHPRNTTQRSIRTAVAKAGEGAYHTFDYATQEAVILKPESQIPLPDYLAENNAEVSQ